MSERVHLVFRSMWLNLASKKRAAAILMELVLHTLAPSHVPREPNASADDLTHPDFAGVDIPSDNLIHS